MWGVLWVGWISVWLWGAEEHTGLVEGAHSCLSSCGQDQYTVLAGGTTFWSCGTLQKMKDGYASQRMQTGAGQVLQAPQVWVLKGHSPTYWHILFLGSGDWHSDGRKWGQPAGLFPSANSVIFAISLWIGILVLMLCILQLLLLSCYFSTSRCFCLGR